MKRETFFNYLIILLNLSIISPIKFFTNDFFLLGLFLFLSILFIKRNEKVDPFIIFLLIFLFIVNIISDLVWQDNNFIVVSGFALRIINIYMSLKILKARFWDIYLKIVLFFALISIPFYIIQLFYPQFFLSMYPYFSWIDADVRKESGKYGFLIHVLHIGMEYRNSGFAVEPGMFGYFLGLGIVLQLLKNNFQIDRYVIVVSLIGLTTISTSFYLFLWLALSIILIYKRNPLVYLFGFVVVVYLASVLYQLDFMTGKIILTYNGAMDTFDKGYQNMKSDGLNRVGGIIMDIDDFLVYPIGYGFANGRRYTLNGTMISSPNGLGSYIRLYGVIGILFLIIAFRRAGPFLNQYRSPKFISVGLSLCLIIFLFSNPLHRDPFFLAFLFSSFVLKGNQLNRNMFYKEN